MWRSFETVQDFEMMTQEDANRPERHTGPNRHLFSNRMTTRLLHKLPSFGVVEELPEHLSNLLERLESAERENSERQT